MRTISDAAFCGCSRYLGRFSGVSACEAGAVDTRTFATKAIRRLLPPGCANRFRRSWDGFGCNWWLVPILSGTLASAFACDCQLASKCPRHEITHASLSPQPHVVARL